MPAHQFQTEVSQLLKLIIHSLYSHKEIFLRELISNSSDALDKLKYLTVTDEKFKSLEYVPAIDISFSAEAKTLEISDTGIGMNEKDLTDNLGTIARSGTRKFLESLSADARKDSNLIGQFGVGFYSAFMVADKVEVISRKAGEVECWKWSSDGKEGFDLSAVPADSAEYRAVQGTTVKMFLNAEGEEYTSRWSLEEIIKKYSNHVAAPIWLNYLEDQYDDKGEKKGDPLPKREQINSANALWSRPKTELTEKDYFDFYKSISGDTEDPLHYVHTKAEGSLEYTTLFYVPKKAPFDMNYADYRPGVKLYVKRVFITDDDKELLPTYLRFVRGVIDSEDLQLNVSREILQQNKIMVNIRNASVKKILSELKALSDNNKEKYLEFIREFNRPLKEGLYSDYANREALLELVRFKSSLVDGYTSMADYKTRMKADQKAIYYLAGTDENRLKNSPLLELYKKQGIEVLIMDEDIDSIVMTGVPRYGELEIKAVNQSGADEDLGVKADEEKTKDFKSTADKIKNALGEAVKDVRISSRLADSPACVVEDKDDPSAQMREMMRAMGQRDLPEPKPILEINPNHDLIAGLKDETSEEEISDVAHVLLGQALLVEGQALKNPADFVKRLNRLIVKA
jgi:molecular chaperone HtpG